jgi:acyl carrier protein
MDENQIKHRLRDFICSELLHNPTYPLADDEQLISGGLIDSFSLAQIGVFVDIEFGVFIPDPELTVARMNTLNDIVFRVREKLT